MATTLKTKRQQRTYRRYLARTAPPVSSLDAAKTLKRLHVKGFGLHTSEGAYYNGTIFARDSAIVGRELIDDEPSLARDVIVRLATLQGVTINPLSDEENGRIHHESRHFGFWQAPLYKKIQRRLFAYLWGGNGRKMTTYFSMDSTPLYILLVADYAVRYPDILTATVERHDGSRATIKQSLVAATEWLVGHHGESGLIEIPRRNAIGLQHQTWKDSSSGYIHQDGSPLNITRPVAYLEVQALAVEALDAASVILKSDDGERAARWRALADQLAATTITRFWLPEQSFFASAIDQDHHGHERIVTTEQSDPGWLLNTRLLDGLPADEKKRYVSAIATRLFGSDFLTDAGIRCRSLAFAARVPLADYHGSLTSWPIDTFLIAKGLRRQGLPKLAQQLEWRVLNATRSAGNFYEFFYVQPDGRVVVDPVSARAEVVGATELPVQMFPEQGIAWTAAAVLRIERDAHKKPTHPQTAWQAALETEILAAIATVRPLVGIGTAIRRTLRSQPVHLNFITGGQQSFQLLSRLYRQYVGRR